MHAGDVVRLPGTRIEAFYSQNWAFARFLWEGNNGAYRSSFRRMLSDIAQGDPYDPTGTMHRARRIPGRRRASSRCWSITSARDLGTLEQEYQGFIHKIAYEKLGQQWMAKP
jgi:hypothetical protein